MSPTSHIELQVLRPKRCRRGVVMTQTAIIASMITNPVRETFYATE